MTDKDWMCLRTMWPTSFIMLHLPSGILWSWSASNHKVYTPKVYSFHPRSQLWLWASFATDILIAVTMTLLVRRDWVLRHRTGRMQWWKVLTCSYLQLKSRSKGCSQNARTAAKRLLILTLETNTLTGMLYLYRLFLLMLLDSSIRCNVHRHNNTNQASSSSCKPGIFIWCSWLTCL